MIPNQEQYLTISETAALLKVSPKRVRNLMCEGVLRQGQHFYRPRGLGARFKLTALQAYIESEDQPKESNVIELKRGCVLRLPTEAIAVRK